MSKPASSTQPQRYHVASTNDIHRLAVYEWNDVKEPIGVLHLVHGMKEHMLRYDDFARYLNMQGFIVVGYDHLGHGNTVESPDDFGYFGDSQGARHLKNDCTMMTLYFAEKYFNFPLYLLGHSMGSFITRLSLLQSAPFLSGYICMGTAGPQPIMAFGRVYSELLSLLRGTRNSTTLTDKLLETYSLRRIPEAHSSNAWISRDPETVRKYDEDPKTSFLFTNQGFADLFDLQLACNQKEWFQRYPNYLPIYLVSGEEDPIGNFGKDVPRIASMLLDAGAKDVSYKLYPRARHEILNEVNREQVYYDISAWMEDHLPYAPDEVPHAQV